MKKAATKESSEDTHVKETAATIVTRHSATVHKPVSTTDEHVEQEHAYIGAQMELKENKNNQTVSIGMDTTPVNVGITASSKAEPVTATPLSESTTGGTDLKEASEISGIPPTKKLRTAKKKTKLAVGDQREAAVILRDGVQLSLHVHQHFPTRARVKEYIQDFALAQSKRARLDPGTSGGKNFVFICNSSTKCDFFVRVVKCSNKNMEGYHISSFHAEHGPECTGSEAITQRQVVNHLLNANAVNALPRLSGFHVRSIVRANEGITVPSRMAYRAKDAVAGSLFKHVVSGIQKLESLLKQFQARNPFSSVCIEMENGMVFKRAFLLLPYACKIQQKSARILGLDGAPMSHSSNYSGTSLELVAKDGNNDSSILAVALCQEKNVENYIWFFHCCITAGLVLDVPMFCDRTSALTRAVESVSGSGVLIQCTQHLIEKMEEVFKSSFGRDLQQHVWRAQAADTQEEFESILTMLAMGNPRASDYIRSIDPDTWAKYCFLRKHALYGWQTTKLTTAENPAIASARLLAPFDFFQHYMERSMSDLYERKRDAKEWMQRGQVLTAYAEGIVQEQSIEASSCCVSPSDGETGTAYVWDTRSHIPKKRRVNLSAQSCSCPFPGQFGLPCKHLVAAILFFNKSGGSAQWDIHQFCDPFYMVQNYHCVYGNAVPIQIPVDEELTRNEAVKVVQVSAKKCSLCKGVGHNKKNCRTRISDI